MAGGTPPPTFWPCSPPQSTAAGRPWSRWRRLGGVRAVRRQGREHPGPLSGPLQGWHHLLALPGQAAGAVRRLQRCRLHWRLPQHAGRL
eukprot:SM002202S07083  [mRNA]  locus=s2202:1455:1848:- [translate_table: standard]